jgi:hypothetical protein
MAEQLYFVRMRGTVTGPYSVVQMQSLHARGQLGRFIEVSLDQVTWKPAGSVRGLFPEAMATVARQVEDVYQAVASPGPAESADMSPVRGTTIEPSPVSEGEWYYLDRNDAQQGPVSLDDLQRLLDGRQIEPATYACKPGMDQWVEVRTLLSPRQSGAANAGSLAWLRQRGLLIALIVVPVIGMALVAVLGTLTVSRFLRSTQAEGVLYGFLAFIVLLLTGVGTTLLAVLYQRQVARLRRKSTP